MKIFILALLLVFSTTSFASEAVTKDGHPACFKEKWHQDLSSFAGKDMASFEAYISSRKCIILKQGLIVRVTDSWSSGSSGSSGDTIHNTQLSVIKSYVPRI